MRPRPETESLTNRVHGGCRLCELDRLGLGADEVIDFSVCSNPYGGPPGLRSSLRSVALHSYPDPDCTAFRSVLSQNLGVPPERILTGNGSIELLRLVALAYVRPGDTIVVPQPTFSEYELSCRLMGAAVAAFPLDEGEVFRIDADRLCAEVRKLRPRAVFLCNPNNPTGWYLDKREVRAVLDACEDTLLVLDEAYAGFTRDRWESTELLEHGHLLIIRSMTKDYGLAGLRLGFALGNEGIMGPLRRVQLPWSVNSLAQAGGIHAVRSGGAHLRKSSFRLAKAKERLIAELDSIGLSVIRGDANFFMVKVGDATSLRIRLLRHGVMVRDCTSFGLPAFIRIGVRTPEENQRLVTALRGVL
ncbi:MAG: histidinol-phosphate aminotransferase family protein [Chloroflexi bacterium]|nr:histidinol-phosphate aminotransferase family protein [Chloroflexota bacterium]